jgi:hypothetical protein
MTVRAAEQFAQAKKPGPSCIKKAVLPHKMCKEWGDSLTKKLSSKVDVQINELGAGRIVMRVESEEETEWLINCILGS